MFELKQEYVEYLDTFKKLGIRPFRREAILRKKLGDHVSILVLRDILFSILMLSPKRYIPFIYSWGKFVGTHSARQAMDVLNIAFVASTNPITKGVVSKTTINVAKNGMIT